MRRIFTITLSVILIIGCAPAAKAAKSLVLNKDRLPTEFQVNSAKALSGLTSCSESEHFKDRAG